MISMYLREIMIVFFFALSFLLGSSGSSYHIDNSAEELTEERKKDI